MQYFIQQTINALGWSSVIALLSAGYTMTFGIVGLVNFAHGEVMMVGAIAAYFAITVLKLPFWVGVIASLGASIAAGFLVERICFKPVRGSGMITLFITSLGASIILKNSSVMLFGDELKSFVVPSALAGVYRLGDLFLFKKSMTILLVTLVIGFVIAFFIKNTKMGVAMRSISYDSQLSQTMGINTEKIIIATFIISSALCGVAAISWGVLFGAVSSSMGTTAVISAFIATVLGGIGNVMGAIVSGFILGVGGTLFIAYLPPDLVGLRPLFVWIVFFIILMVKPNGLFRANIK